MAKRKQALENLSTMGQRFDWLLKNHLSPDGDEYTYSELVAAMKLRGTDISESILSRLRSGQTQHPSWQVIDALCSVFGVPLNFFSLTRTLEEEELTRYRTADALKQKGAEEIAFRAARLTPQHRQVVLGLINNLNNLEGTNVSPDESVD